MRSLSALVLALLTLFLSLLSHGVARAQLRGHYFPGTTGLQNGTQPAPGISLLLPFYLYTSNTITDSDAPSTGGSPDVAEIFVGTGLGWVWNKKILGGNLAGQVIPVAFTKSRIEAASLDVSSSFGFGDIIVQPLQLGWHGAAADYVLGWTAFAPTGKWELEGSENSGLGMWSHDFQAGTTLRLGADQSWTTSLLASYEIHSKKKDEDIKVGDILTLEGGTGTSFSKKIEGTSALQTSNFGLVYYAQLKLKTDEVSDPVTSALFGRTKDHVYGIGVEANKSLPKKRLLLGLRFLPEFGAKNRTQGLTFMFSLSYLAKSLSPSSP